MIYETLTKYSKRDLNPHSRNGQRIFRSFLENGCKDKQFPRYSQTFHRKKLTK